MTPQTHKFRRLALLLCTAVLSVIALLVFGISSISASDYSHAIDTYWDIHDQVLYPTERGRHYIDLFWQHGLEISAIIFSDAAIQDEAQGIIFLFEPSLRALVDGHGDEVIITEEMARRAADFLTILEEHGSAVLRTTIQTERVITPFEPLIGLTFEEARLVLVGPPQYPLPEPLPTCCP